MDDPLVLQIIWVEDPFVLIADYDSQILIGMAGYEAKYVMIPVRDNELVPLGPQIDEMRYRKDKATGEILSPEEQFKEAVYKVLLELQGVDDSLDELVEAIYRWLRWYFSDALRKLELDYKTREIEEDEIAKG